MNVKLSAKEFAQRLKFVTKIVNEASPIPVMSHVVIETGDNEVSLTTTDYEVAVTISCPAVVVEAGKTSLPAKRLLDTVLHLSNDAFELKQEKKAMALVCGAFKSHMQAIGIESFPELPSVPTDREFVFLDGPRLREMLKQVRCAMGGENARYFIKGIYLTITNDIQAVVAMDGLKVALASTQAVKPGNASVLIPKRMVDVLLSDNSDDLMLVQTNRHMFFVSDDVEMMSVGVEGQFPAYERVIPKNISHEVLLEREPLQKAIKRVALTTPGDTNAVTFTLKNNRLWLSSIAANIGDASEEIACGYSGSEIVFKINYLNVLDFLQNAKRPLVRLKIQNPESPVIWTDEDEYLMVMMLMRN